jgi:hypothetical protein
LNFLGVTNIALLKGISPSRFGCGKEVWKFCLKFFFSFSGDFFFCTVAPLNLAHSNLLVPCDSFGRLQLLERVLLICKVFARNQIFLWNLFFRYSQTFLQLKYVEYIMYSREMRGQFQLISHFSFLFQDLEWASKSRCKLSYDFKLTESSHR